MPGSLDWPNSSQPIRGEDNDEEEDGNEDVSVTTQLTQTVQPNIPT
jgi:hypothetical protein